jgi:hypothetical protein
MNKLVMGSAMFSKYFEDLGNELIKAAKAPKPKKSAKTDGAVQKEGVKKPSSQKKRSSVVDQAKIKEVLEKLIPSNLAVNPVVMTDAGGYRPEGVDYVIYKEMFRNIDVMMGGAVPSELVYGAVFICETLNRATLFDVLTRVANTKKLNMYTDIESESVFIPAFILSLDMDITYPELQQMILDFYTKNALDNHFEFDIIGIINQGVVIKDWREKRSFKALDTGKDTMKWFFILMNEYLDVEKGALDFRNYVSETRTYDEY